MIQDLRYGVRMLLKSPVFTLAAILSLAIGIGANTALFSVVNAVLWRPLPYPDAERLIRVSEGFPPATFVAISEANRVFDGLAAWNNSRFTLTGRGEPTRLTGRRVTQGFLSLLGVTPQAGRSFAAEEFQPGRDQVAIISDRLWRDRFGADPQIIGQAVTLDELSYTIIGVTPPRFDSFPSADLLTPLAITSKELSEDGRDVASVARLKQGVTLERAQQELAVIARCCVRLQPLRELLVEDFRLTLLAVWGVAGFVLLIACANLANLTLVRAANRQKELAVRAAIGARRLRLMRQLLTESVLVALLGGALGLLFAYFGVKVLSAANPVILPLSSEPTPSYGDTMIANLGGGVFYGYGSSGMESIPRLGEVVIDGEVLVFTLVIALITGTLFGLAPALQFSRPDLSHALKDGAAVSGVGFRFRKRRRTQSLLVIGEVALALVLLAGAGLLIRSIWRLHEEKLGFQPERLLTMQLNFPSYKYRNDVAVNSFITQLSERLAALPGVERASAANTVPLSKLGGFASITIEGRPVWSKPKEKEKPKDLRPVAFFSKISPNYIHTMGIPLRQGREFDAHDNRQSLPVIIINEEMARRYWPGENPVGKRLKLGIRQEPWLTVIGVVGNVKRFALEDQTIPEFYLSLPQYLENLVGMDMFSLGTFVVVRVAGRPADLAEAMRQTVWSLDRDLPIQRIVTMEDRVAEVFAPRRFNMLLFGVFALVALLLAALGIYGVIAYSVAQRTHEIGIRMALGATSRDVLLLVVRQGMILMLIGVAVGLVAALALTRVLRNLLFGVSATDPATFIGIALLLTGVALIASYIPARRATKVDPLVALRHE
jgi:putative ABC transport system permease protein